MPALIEIDWKISARSVVKGSTQTSLTALIQDPNASGSSFWTTFIEWELGRFQLAEARLLVETKEREIFRPGARLTLFRPDYSTIGEITVILPGIVKASIQ